MLCLSCPESIPERREHHCASFAQQEEARERERQKAQSYRLRLVPRVSSVTRTGMTVSLPPFLVAAARGTRRCDVLRAPLPFLLLLGYS